MAAVVSQAAGCTITSNSSEDATITARWSIETVAGSPATCPPGYDTAALYSQPVDSSNHLIGSPTIDLFNCADGVGVTDPLAPDVYASWIAITTADNSNTYAESTKAIVDVVDVDKDYNAKILTDGGYFQMTWDLVGKTSNQPVTCSQAGTQSPSGGVEAVVTVTSGTAAKTDQFNCEDGYGLTAAFLEGSYTVSVDAFSTAGAEGTAPTLSNKLIHNKNQITDLGNVIIPIDGL